MPGRDEDFKRMIQSARQGPHRGVILGGGDQVPQVTHTTIALRSNTLRMVRLSNDEGEVVGYQMVFMDPHLHRTIVFDMSPENLKDFHADVGDMLAGKTDEE